MADVTFAVKLPLGGNKTHDDAARIATAAEDSGFDAAWHSEHIVFTGEVPDDYPYAEGGESPFSTDQNAFDAFETLSYLAALTDDIRLGTNVCVTPLRHPVLLTKLALTLDNLSDGRFDFGLGVGWLRTEFESLGVPFEERGSRTDEFLDVFRRACDTAAFSYDGPHHSFPTTGFHPRPIQDGGPPVWIGGDSGATFRRVGQYGDGWMAIGFGPEELAARIDRITEAWTDYDRAGEPEISIRHTVHLGERPEDMHPPMVGAVDDVVEDVRALAESGATTIVCDFRRNDETPIRRFGTDEQVEAIERFDEDVIPQFQD